VVVVVVVKRKKKYKVQKIRFLVVRWYSGTPFATNSQTTALLGRSLLASRSLYSLTESAWARAKTRVIHRSWLTPLSSALGEATFPL